MRSILVVGICAVALLALGQVSKAEDKSDGCGLGWYVTEKKTLLATSVRATTNYYLPRSFSITSGTSGCKPHTLVEADREAAQYAEVNREALLLDMASGQGEYLDAFASVLGCNDSARESFGRKTQQEYRTLLDTGLKSGVDMYIEVKRIIQTDADLANSCAKVG